MAKKDYNLPKHNEIDTKNLYVRCASHGTMPSCLRSVRIANSETGRQSLPIAHIPGLSEDSIFLAMVLLHPDARGARLSSRMATSPRRDRPGHAHQAATLPRASQGHDGW